MPCQPTGCTDSPSTGLQCHFHRGTRGTVGPCTAAAVGVPCTAPATAGLPCEPPPLPSPRAGMSRCRCQPPAPLPPLQPLRLPPLPASCASRRRSRPFAPPPASRVAPATTGLPHRACRCWPLAPCPLLQPLGLPPLPASRASQRRSRPLAPPLPPLPAGGEVEVWGGLRHGAMREIGEAALGSR